MKRSMTRGIFYSVLYGMIACGLGATASQGADWARFRGPNGTGKSADPKPPIRWSDDENLAWKIELPGPGSSSPIVVGDKVFVTCWTGYGVSREEPGAQEDLRRVLLCVDRNDGSTLWSVEVEPSLPEDEYKGMFAQHGYASHTPVSDGERVYAYFGKSGAIAYGFDGNELWRVDCGQGFGAKDWGSAASPILHEGLVIISATAESNALIALDKLTGNEVWRYEREGLDGVWGSPVLSQTDEGHAELVFAEPFRMVGIDPNTGAERWSSVGIDNDTVSTSTLVHGGVAYVLAGRGGSVAVRTGGEGDVTDSRLLWRGSHRGGIATPIYHDGKIYFIGRQGMNCIDASSGDRVYQERFQTAAAEPAPDNENEGQGRRGRRGGFGSIPYASPVVADGVLYAFGRTGEAYVVRLGEEFEQLATNQLADGGDFSGTPALSNGQMFVRSSKALYCIEQLGGAAQP